MAQPEPHWNNASLVNAQVEELLQRFSIEQKIDLVSGRHRP